MYLFFSQWNFHLMHTYAFKRLTLYLQPLKHIMHTKFDTYFK